jgi:hypothetical protein
MSGGVGGAGASPAPTRSESANSRRMGTLARPDGLPSFALSSLPGPPTDRRNPMSRLAAFREFMPLVEQRVRDIE